MSEVVRETFPRQARLLNAVDYQPVFKNNIRFGDSNITLLVSKKNGVRARLGFAIAKKQIKRAIDRNRLKRVFRQNFRLRQTFLPKRDIVVLVRNQILSLSNQQINELQEKNWTAVIKQCAKP